MQRQQRQLPANMLREIYKKADRQVQARMRASTKDVLELPAPQMPVNSVNSLVRQLRAAMARFEVFDSAVGRVDEEVVYSPEYTRGRMAYVRAEYYLEVLQEAGAAVPSVVLTPDGQTISGARQVALQVKAAVRALDTAIRNLMKRFSVTDLDMTWTAQWRRQDRKDIWTGIFNPNPWAEAGRRRKTPEGRARRAERVLGRAAGATLVRRMNVPSAPRNAPTAPGGNARFARVPRRSVASAARASAAHPSVAEFPSFQRSAHGFWQS